VCPLLLNAARAVGLAGTEEAPVQLGARLHAAQAPQSAGQFTQLSSPVHMPSPHTAGPSKPASFIMGQSHAPQQVPLPAQDWVPAGCRAPQLQLRNVPGMHFSPPVLLVLLLPPEPVAPAMPVSPEAPQPRAMPPARPPLKTVHASA